MFITDKAFLRQKCRPTTLAEVNEINLITTIKAELKTAWCPGYGLAAIQVGQPLAMCWYSFPGPAAKEGQTSKEVLLINPKIIARSVAVIMPDEGCLSIPNKRFRTLRYKVIFLKDDNMYPLGKELMGLEAIICQHEIDHINGILCDQRIAPTGKKIGRNDSCLCGSGKKYKKCCGGK